MSERRWPLVLAVVAVLVVAGGAFAIGRSTAPEGAAPTSPTGRPALTQTVGGVTIGVAHSRSGALAASDNYVATATESFVQDPSRYEQLVRRVYAPNYQQTALAEAKQTRERSTNSVTFYSEGGKTVALVAARRLDGYSRTAASVTSWVGAFNWGDDERPGQTWRLVETSLRWDGQRWLVTGLNGATRPAPTPSVVGYDTAESRTNGAFDRELRGMTAPTYGGD
jgi:hypothetical protein